MLQLWPDTDVTEYICVYINAKFKKTKGIMHVKKLQKYLIKWTYINTAINKLQINGHQY